MALSDILPVVNDGVSSPTWESQPVYDSPEATFPSRSTVLGSVRCSLGLSLAGERGDSSHS